MRSLILAAAMAFVVTGGVAARADDAQKPAAEPKETTSQAPTPAPAAAAKKSPLSGIYKPPAPDERLEGGTVPGGTRSARASTCDATVSLVVPPDHVGFTVEEQPTLYFVLSKDTTCSVELVLNDRRQIPPVVEAPVKTPPRAGLNALRLAEFGIKLEPNVTYDWFVQVKAATGSRAPESYAGGQIRRVTAPPDLAAELAMPGARRATALGQRSLWYDAVAALGAEVEAAPNEAAAREARAVMLEGAGLGDAAAAERQGGVAEP